MGQISSRGSGRAVRRRARGAWRHGRWRTRSRSPGRSIGLAGPNDTNAHACLRPCSVRPAAPSTDIWPALTCGGPTVREYGSLVNVSALHGRSCCARYSCRSKGMRRRYRGDSDVSPTAILGATIPARALSSSLHPCVRPWADLSDLRARSRSVASSTSRRGDANELPTLPVERDDQA